MTSRVTTSCSSLIGPFSPGEGAPVRVATSAIGLDSSARPSRLCADVWNPAARGLRSAVMAAGQESTITRGFLFADLRGYTDFVEQRGAAAAAALLTQYRALARDAIAQFGGAEIKTEGDSFYVVFDSVSGAVRCGLAITTAARAAADEPIRVGVGIHAGETIEADGGYVGSPVNIAARICAQAGPGRSSSAKPSGPHGDRPPGPVQVARPASAEGHRRADRALRGTGGGRRATAWPSTGRRRLSRRARAGLVGGAAVLVTVVAAIGWLALQPSTGLPSGPWTIGVEFLSAVSPQRRAASLSVTRCSSPSTRRTRRAASTAWSWL